MENSTVSSSFLTFSNKAQCLFFFLSFTLFLVLIHTANEDQDLTKLWCDLREKVSLVSTQGEYVGGQSGFAHVSLFLPSLNRPARLTKRFIDCRWILVGLLRIPLFSILFSRYVE